MTPPPAVSTVPSRVVERSFAGPRSGCALSVSSTFSGEETGTMHYAERVALRVGSGTQLVLLTDVEAGTLAPIVEHAHDIGGAFLVMGWSSTGAGMQTNSALIVDARGCASPRLVSRLDVLSSRARAGVLLGADGASVGVPLHPEDTMGFEVTVGERRLSMLDLGGLPAAQVGGASWYAPPGGAATQRQPASVAAVWFAATPSGFRLPTP